MLRQSRNLKLIPFGSCLRSQYDCVPPLCQTSRYHLLYNLQSKISINITLNVSYLSLKVIFIAYWNRDFLICVNAILEQNCYLQTNAVAHHATLTRVSAQMIPWVFTQRTQSYWHSHISNGPPSEICDCLNIINIVNFPIFFLQEMYLKLSTCCSHCQGLRVQSSTILPSILKHRFFVQLLLVRSPLNDYET